MYRQLLICFPQLGWLYCVQTTLLETVERPGLQHLKGVKSFLDAKNLKGLTKGCIWAGMITRFRRFCQPAVNKVYGTPFRNTICKVSPSCIVVQYQACTVVLKVGFGIGPCKIFGTLVWWNSLQNSLRCLYFDYLLFSMLCLF